MTSRAFLVLCAVTIVACSQTNPAAPTAISNAGPPATEAPIAASANHIVASIPLSVSFGVNATGVTSVRLFLGFPDLPIFDVVLKERTHRMLVAGSATPGFDTIVARLTDQVDDVMSFRSLLLPNEVGQGPADATLQSALLRGANLEGASIKTLRLKIEDLSIVSPGSDAAGNGIWTDYRLRATLLIEQ